MVKFLNINTDVYNQTSSFVLDGVGYILHCYWNSRGGWYLSFYDPNLFTSVSESISPETGLICAGLKVMPDPSANFVAVSPDIGLPEGILTTIDTNPNTEDEDEPRIKVDNFGRGKRFQLLYVTENEKLNLFGE